MAFSKSGERVGEHESPPRGQVVLGRDSLKINYAPISNKSVYSANPDVSSQAYGVSSVSPQRIGKPFESQNLQTGVGPVEDGRNHRKLLRNIGAGLTSGTRRVRMRAKIAFRRKSDNELYARWKCLGLSRMEDCEHPRENSGFCSLVFLVFFFLEVFINYDSGAIPAALSIISSEFDLTSTWQGTLGALPYVGLTLASPVVGKILSRYSPKQVIVWTMALNVLASIQLTISVSAWMLLSSRLLCGLTQAAFVIYAPVWVDEFAPPEKVTLWMGMIQGATVVGVTIGYLAAGFISHYGQNWRWAVVIQNFFLTLFVVTVCYFPGELIDPGGKEKSALNDTACDANRGQRGDMDRPGDTSSLERMDQVGNFVDTSPVKVAPRHDHKEIKSIEQKTVAQFSENLTESPSAHIVPVLDDAVFLPPLHEIGHGGKKIPQFFVEAVDIDQKDSSSGSIPIIFTSSASPQSTMHGEVHCPKLPSRRYEDGGFTYEEHYSGALQTNAADSLFFLESRRELQPTAVHCSSPRTERSAANHTRCLPLQDNADTIVGSLERGVTEISPSDHVTGERGCPTNASPAQSAPPGSVRCQSSNDNAFEFDGRDSTTHDEARIDHVMGNLSSLPPCMSAIDPLDSATKTGLTSHQKARRTVEAGDSAAGIADVLPAKEHSINDAEIVLEKKESEAPGTELSWHKYAGNDHCLESSSRETRKSNTANHEQIELREVENSQESSGHTPPLPLSGSRRVASTLVSQANANVTILYSTPISTARESRRESNASANSNRGGRPQAFDGSGYFSHSFLATTPAGAVFEAMQVAAGANDPLEYHAQADFSGMFSSSSKPPPEFPFHDHDKSSGGGGGGPRPLGREIQMVVHRDSAYDAEDIDLSSPSSPPPPDVLGGHRASCQSLATSPDSDAPVPQGEGKGDDLLSSNDSQSRIGIPHQLPSSSRLEKRKGSTTWESVVCLLRSPVYVWTVFTLCALLFVVTGVQFWSTKFFTEYLKVEPWLAMVTFSATASTAPTAGVLAGGYAIDKLGGYKTQAGMLRSLVACSCWAACAVASGVTAGFISHYAVVIACIWLLLFFGGALLPPLTGILIATVEIDLRTFASGFSMFLYNVFGYALGVVMDIFKASEVVGMRIVLFWSIFGLAGVVCAAWSAQRLHLRAEFRKLSDAEKSTSHAISPFYDPEEFDRIEENEIDFTVYKTEDDFEVPGRLTDWGNSLYE